jgi:hypothetical protein
VDRFTRLELEVEVGSGTGALPLGQLADRLQTAGVDRVRSPEVDVPGSGVRGGELGAPGTLLLTLAGSGDLLRMVVDTIRSWLLGAQARSAKLTIGDNTIEVTGLTSRKQDELIRLWVERVLAGAPTGSRPTPPAGKPS